jgi:type II secretory pathway pseudopilin PulG
LPDALFVADRNNEDGFTIVETVVAAAILATALVALAQVIALATTAAARARDTTRATLAAAQKIEELRANAAAAAPVDATDAVGHGLIRRWTITALPAGSGVAITVEVTHLGRSIPHVMLETIRARPGREVEP